MEVIRNNMAARTTDLRLYLDVIPDVNKVEVGNLDFSASLELIVPYSLILHPVQS